MADDGPYAELVERAKADPAMVRDFGRPGATRLIDVELGHALWYVGDSARHAVYRIAAGAPRSAPVRQLLLALLSGWRPEERP